MLYTMGIDKEELTKLSPKERIKKLKLMEKERKQDVNEIERLIQESMKELRTDKIAEEIAPQQKAVDISTLFEAPEQGLEKSAKEALKQSTSIKGRGEYQAGAQPYYHSKTDGGTVPQQPKMQADREATEVYMTEGEKLVSKTSAGRATVYKLRKETGLDLRG